MTLLWVRWIVRTAAAAAVVGINAVVQAAVATAIVAHGVGIVAHLGAGCRGRHFTISLFLLFHQPNGLCESSKFWIVTFCRRR